MVEGEVQSGQGLVAVDTGGMGFSQFGQVVGRVVKNRAVLAGAIPVRREQPLRPFGKAAGLPRPLPLIPLLSASPHGKIIADG